MKVRDAILASDIERELFLEGEKHRKGGMRKQTWIFFRWVSPWGKPRHLTRVRVSARENVRFGNDW